MMMMIRMTTGEKLQLSFKLLQDRLTEQAEQHRQQMADLTARLQTCDSRAAQQGCSDCCTGRDGEAERQHTQHQHHIAIPRLTQLNVHVPDPNTTSHHLG